MAILKILTYPDPFLKEKTRPVEKIDAEIDRLIEDMAETMYEAPGVGLAAPQIGSDRSIIVYDPRPSEEEARNFQVLINPVILSMEGEMISENEGCLSVPEFRADVKRAEYAVVEGLDRHGNPVHIDAEGMLAIILQHEIDHLNGVLFIDRISKLKKEMYKRKVKKHIRQNA